MAENARYNPSGEGTIPKHRNISKDELTHLTGRKAEEKCPYSLRKIEMYPPETNGIIMWSLIVMVYAFVFGGFSY